MINNFSVLKVDGCKFIFVEAFFCFFVSTNYLWRRRYKITMRRISLFILWLTVGYSCFADQQRPIACFDLKYTLKADYTDSLQLLSVWDDLHTVSVLQGIVNRKAPRLYVNYVVESAREIDTYWWNKYRRPGQWLADRDTLPVADIEQLVRYFRDDIRGVVVYDPLVASTSNVASAVAGIENLIAVRYDLRPRSLYMRLVVNGPELPVRVWLVQPDGTPLFTGQGIIPQTSRASSGSVKNDPYLWFIERYMKTGRCNGAYAGYYIDQKWREAPLQAVPNHHTLTNHDFFVSRRAFFFDLSPWADEPATDDPGQVPGLDRLTLAELLSEAYRLNKGKQFCYIGGFPAWAFKYTHRVGGGHEDVATEWEFSKMISAYNAFKDADAIAYGALANASFWQHFPLKKQYPQPWITTAELKERGLLNQAGGVQTEGKNYLIFYVGDYDASAWITQRTPDIWDDPDRGKLPLMWSVSPVLATRVPMVMHNFRTTATPNDYFVAADNGAGYLMPGMLQEPRDLSGFPDGLDAWARHCGGWYRKFGLTITGFVIDGEAPALNDRGLDCYASFSPNGIVPQKSPLTRLYKDMPILRSDHDVNESDPKAAARHLVDRIHARPLPFHWFRNILKSPGWYVEVMKEVKRLDPSIELLDAPAFFELYRRWLRENPDHAGR